MSIDVPFKVVMKGGMANRHQFTAYEGFNTLAGMSWTLALVANYVETGKVRHKGTFPGRDAVIASAPVGGSVLVDYVVSLASKPELIFGSGVTISSTVLMQSLLERVISRNIGKEVENKNLQPLLHKRSGDIEALVAATEPSVRQAHDVIGNGAANIEVSSGFNIAKFDKKTKEYVRSSQQEGKVITRKFMVTGFYGNSGHGSVFDAQLGRNVPFTMKKAVLDQCGPTFSWGLDQYTNDTGSKVLMTYTRVLAMDDTPKKYQVLSAKPA